MNWLGDAFSMFLGPWPQAEEERPRSNPHVQRTEADLEMAIEAAGRDKVFEVVRRNGWDGFSTPPHYVWWAAVAQVNFMAKEADEHPQA